jgi:alanine dehydrogenase
MTEILFLSRCEIEPLLTQREMLDATERANGLFVKSKAGENPASFSPMVAFHTKIPNSDIDYRASTMDPVPTLCSTLGFGYGDNPSKHGLTGLFAVAVLAKLETGEPVAVMEAEYLANMRTGASAVVASKYLARPDSERLAFIGTGNLARHMLNAHVEQYGRAGEVRAWSRSEAMRERFAAEMRERHGLDVQAVDSAAAAIEGADIVYGSSRSREPRVTLDLVRPGMHINAYGSDASGKQEVAPEVVRSAKVVVDSLEQCKIGGEVQHTFTDGSMADADVHAELGEIVNGDKPGRESDDEVTLMDSTGLSAIDTVVFDLAYERAKERGVGTRLEL